MPDASDLSGYLAGASVDAEVLALRPDYRALLMVVDGLAAGSGNDESEDLLRRAEQHATDRLRDLAVVELPHVAAWRDAYRAFGAKPQRTRNSLEALVRRAPDGLPRVNRLTDLYNAISVLHEIPLGGEDFDRYAGPPRLVRADGSEPFDTVADGAPVVDHPEPGEVVWRDDRGVTCRRWNWRQGRRTQLTPETSTALFVLDVLAPVTDEEVHAAADALMTELTRLGPGVVSARRLVGQGSAERV